MSGENMSMKDRIEDKAKELFVVNWDNYEPSVKKQVESRFSRTSSKTRKRYLALSRHVLASEIKARLEEQEKYALWSKLRSSRIQEAKELLRLLKSA